MSSIFRSSSSREKTLAEEMTTTMSTLLEDTILKNIQLKTDIETLGDEVARLSAENGALLQRLGMRSSVSSPVLSASSPSVPASLRHAPPAVAAAAGGGGGGGGRPTTAARDAPTDDDDDQEGEAEGEP